jgi:hypothetical protein
VSVQIEQRDGTIAVGDACSAQPVNQRLGKDRQSVSKK